MLMALNRHLLHDSLLKVQRHIATSGSSLKAITLAAVTNNDKTSSTSRRSSSFQQQSSSDSEGDECLKKTRIIIHTLKNCAISKRKTPPRTVKQYNV